MVSDQQQSLVPGALVQWGHAQAYGVIVANDGQMIHVHWDDERHPPQFSASDPPPSRVDFIGRPVQRKSTGQNVAVLGPVAAATPTWRCQIFSSTGTASTAYVPEADLRPLAMTDPLERFRAGEIGSTKRYLLRQVAQQYRMQNLQDDLVSLGQSQVDIQPHQVSVVHKVISYYPHRFLLCDEVGLGKTIEAGMALKELRARGGAQRVLAIVPPNLVRQWQFEMRTKFNEPFAVLNTATVNNFQANGYHGNPFAHPDYPSLLCSSRWVSNRRWKDLCTEAYWDLIILDEAHHARSYPDGTTTALYRLVRDLAPEEHPQRMMLFLTATPMQLNTHELYSLVEILDPILFPSEEDFEQHRRATPGLSRLVESLSHRVFPIHGQGEEETAQTVEHVAAWLEMDAREVRGRLSAGQDELQEIADKLADKHRLSEVLIRNRKALVGGFMPRTAFRWEVDLSPEERNALQAVEDYVRFGYQFAADTNANAIGFLMVIFQKLTASSIAAIRQSLLRRREKVQAISAAGNASPDDMEEMLDDDLNACDVVEMGTTIADRAAEELLFLDNAIGALNAVGETDSKARVRGNLAYLEVCVSEFGSIPACAGEPMTAGESSAISSIFSLMNEYPPFAKEVIDLWWVPDDMPTVEQYALGDLRDLARSNLALARQVIGEPFMGPPFRQRDEYALNVLSQFALDPPGSTRGADLLAQLAAEAWFSDGLDALEAALLYAIIFSAKDFEQALIETHYVASAPVTLPWLATWSVWSSGTLRSRLTTTRLQRWKRAYEL